MCGNKKKGKGGRGIENGGFWKERWSAEKEKGMKKEEEEEKVK